jgi:hypothetical protein
MGTNGLDLAGVLAPADAKDYLPAGQPQRTPHRQDIEAAADFQFLLTPLADAITGPPLASSTGKTQYYEKSTTFFNHV